MIVSSVNKPVVKVNGEQQVSREHREHVVLVSLLNV